MKPTVPTLFPAQVSKGCMLGSRIALFICQTRLKEENISWALAVNFAQHISLSAKVVFARQFLLRFSLASLSFFALFVSPRAVEREDEWIWQQFVFFFLPFFLCWKICFFLSSSAAQLRRECYIRHASTNLSISPDCVSVMGQYSSLRACLLFESPPEGHQASKLLLLLLLSAVVDLFDFLGSRSKLLQLPKELVKALLIVFRNYTRVLNSNYIFFPLLIGVSSGIFNQFKM